VLTDRPAERFAVGGRLHREGSDAPLTIVEGRPAAPGWIVRFGEVSTRSAAEPLRGAYLEAVVSRGDGLAPGEHWWHEVVGSPVIDPGGAVLGTVEGLYRAGEAEVLVVGGGPAGTFEVPAARPFVRVLDPGGTGIVVDPATLDLAVPEPGG